MIGMLPDHLSRVAPPVSESLHVPKMLLHIPVHNSLWFVCP